MPEVSLNGNTKVKTFQDIFTKRFPYLFIACFDVAEKEKKSKTPLPADITLAKAGKKKTEDNEFTLRGSQKVRLFEKAMLDDFSIYCEVCFTKADGGRFFTSGDLDELTLKELNDKGQAEGWKKDTPR